LTLALGELADRLGAVLHGDGRCVIRRVATLEHAGPGDVSFLANPRYRRHLATTRASAVILAPRDLARCPVAALVLDNPYLGYARAAALLNPEPERPEGRHPSASVSPEARVEPSAWVGPQAVIEPGALIEAAAYVGPGCVVGTGSRIGKGSRLIASVTVLHGVVIGRRVIVHPGAVLGADGFGIANDGERWVKVPQLGGLRIGDDVEIGANTTIDRGALDDTVIEAGVKLDNQVQIGHNVHIGSHTAIAGCVGIAGSTRIGARCTIGGAVAIGGHLQLADDVHLTGGTVVPKSITRPGVYSSGMMAQDNMSWRRTIARLNQLGEAMRRLSAIERKLER